MLTHYVIGLIILCIGHVRYVALVSVRHTRSGVSWVWMEQAILDTYLGIPIILSSHADLAFLLRHALFFFFPSFGESQNRCATLSTGQDTKAYIEEHIAAVDVMVFAKSYCPVRVVVRRVF